MSVIPPEVAGPNPGGPGHFAHTDWLTQSVKALDAEVQAIAEAVEALLAPAWVPLVLGAGWGAFGGAQIPPAIRKVGDTVQVVGSLQYNGALSVMSTVAIIPPDYLPSHDITPLGIMGADPVRFDLQVSTGTILHVPPQHGFYSISGMWWSTAPVPS